MILPSPEDYDDRLFRLSEFAKFSRAEMPVVVTRLTVRKSGQRTTKRCAFAPGLASYCRPDGHAFGAKLDAAIIPPIPADPGQESPIMITTSRPTTVIIDDSCRPLQA